MTGVGDFAEVFSWFSFVAGSLIFFAITPIKASFSVPHSPHLFCPLDRGIYQCCSIYNPFVLAWSDSLLYCGWSIDDRCNKTSWLVTLLGELALVLLDGECQVVLSKSCTLREGLLPPSIVQPPFCLFLSKAPSRGLHFLVCLL